MCGIYTVATARAAKTPVPDQAFQRSLRAFLSYAPATRAASSVLETAQALRETTLLFLRQGPQLAVVKDQDLAAMLAGAVRDLEAWMTAAEDFAETEVLTQEEEEALNFLVVAARDTSWQLRHDVVENAGKIRALLGEGEPRANVLSHVWHLNLILNNLDRLEVRGRDSAGIAVYVYFPDEGSRDLFLTRPAVAGALDRRAPGGTFHDMTVTVPAAAPTALLFTFKVAEEVGEMGQNVRELRAKIARDAVFQEALRTSGTRLYALAHTRWASNGIISVPNCHPVDSTTLYRGGVDTASSGTFVAALNGDIDNYQELKRQILSGDRSVHPEITTDAKIIPVLMAHLCNEGMATEEAFQEIVRRFEGSLAIALVAANRPGELFLAQKGSGQGLFIGLAGESVAVASEMYGIVELTDRYVKAEGEKKAGGTTVGECFHVRLTGTVPTVSIMTPDGALPLPADRVKQAEITTRDIDRGTYPRYLLKEITESVESVRKTYRSKVELSSVHAQIRLGSDTLQPGFLKRLKDGSIRRIVAIGQGTAAVAAQGIASLMDRAVGKASITVGAMKATELSGHFLRPDMRDTMVIAVSQSGTTTDTNRTVDLVRSRGAYVVGIVNRRNADLVYKADSVLYTSDGRDIEMSVASTKAFYMQNAAGQLLALTLAHHLNSRSEDERRGEIEALTRLPQAMERTLRLAPHIQEIARQHALRRRYWALVGTGPGKIAADEIRIKLSELCYKAIAVDFLEDKKHIDLSSEPLVIVCAAGLNEAQISDAVKEVAIFKAHNSVPIVITEEGEGRFDPYAAASIHVPRYDGSLSFLLPTIVGHLFGYYAADAFERRAIGLRRLRQQVVRRAQRLAERDEEPLQAEITRDTALVSETLKVQALLGEGLLDSGLDVHTGVRLSNVLDFLLGQFSLDQLPVKFGCPGTVTNCLSVAEETISSAINEITRPIDAIKHQAKTVTVGISRLEEVSYEGPLWQYIQDHGLPRETVPTSGADFLSAFGRLVAAIQGAALYEIRALNPLGHPGPRTTLRLVSREGCAADIPSRYTAARQLLGTKLQVVRDRWPYVGFGQKDDRPILIVPFVAAEPQGSMLLIHLELHPSGPAAARLAALRADRDRYNRLVASVTERDIAWSDAVIDRIDNERLFLKSPEEAARAIAEAEAVKKSRQSPC